MTDALTGATRLYPIIGDPVRFTRSPTTLTATLHGRGHDAACLPLEVAAGDLAAVMTGLTASANVDGILVTMPHKAAVTAWCTTLSDRAARLGAVSVLRREPDRSWHGDMLDGLAFVRAQTDHGAVIEGSRALLVGVGGAGSAIALALLESGVRELVVSDVDPARAEQVVAALHSAGPVTVGMPDPTGFDLVLNATPLGLRDDDPSPVDLSRLTAETFVGDVVAGHGPTPLIAAARALGCGTGTGEHMVEAVQELMADFLLGPGSISAAR